MLDHVFSPITIDGVEIRNRTAVPAMVMNFCNVDGTCTERFTAYHEEKAKGGFGLIITEDFAVCPQGKGFVGLPGLWNDDQIAGFKECTRRVKSHGAAFVAQIYHAGRQSHRFIIGQAPEAPSAIPCPFSPSPDDFPEELTVERIHEIVEQFGDCARRAKEAGFDGVEIHGAHGYLIAQFMSPYSNKRTDEYGGPLHNRIRFAQEIIKNIRSKVGKISSLVFVFPQMNMLQAEELWKIRSPFSRCLSRLGSVTSILQRVYTGHLMISFRPCTKNMPGTHTQPKWLRKS
jgi:2,4-dienoyl-CoA reductase-like NADH-dependent reductase (Old Yellow Enzyme family)